MGLDVRAVANDDVPGKESFGKTTWASTQSISLQKSPTMSSCGRGILPHPFAHYSQSITAATF